jgi:glycosyltransferase involved in cell wall biosynthesis
MHVGLVIWSLVAGGAQRALIDISGHLLARGHAVTLITVGDPSSDFFALPAGVIRVALNERGREDAGHSRLRRGARIFRRLRATLRESRPDVVLSFIDITNIAVLLASLRLGIPVVIAERTYPPAHEIGLLWKVLRRLCYPLCSRLVVQTRAVAEWASHILPGQKVEVIPNAVPRFALSGAHGMRARELVVLGVGRLVHSKGFDLLMRAFALSGLAAEGWRLVIVGEGPERSRLEVQAKQLNLSGHVDLRGEVRDPSEEMCRSAIFALPSRYEGFPNVLLEAMVCGAAPVAFDCPSGPREVVRDGANGLLVPADDCEAMASALQRLAADPLLRRRLGALAADVASDYAPELILTRWAKLLEQYG